MKVNAELMEAIDRHMKWRTHQPDGERFVWSKYSRLKDEVGKSFVGAILTGADFSQAELQGVDFTGAILSEANFEYANLEEANFSSAVLNKTNLREVSLFKATLNEAKLFDAILTEADLTEAACTKTIFDGSKLYGADLNGIIFDEASLFEVNLQRAVLDKTVFNKADLRGANLCGAIVRKTEFNSIFYDTTTSFFALVCPEKGSYIGFKRTFDKIIELEIPADALRSSATTRQCRTNKAKVLSITEFDGTPSNVDSVASAYSENFIYKVGETVEVRNFDTDRWNECSTGIHHFLTRQEAVNYVL